MYVEETPFYGPEVVAPCVQVLVPKWSIFPDFSARKLSLFLPSERDKCYALFKPRARPTPPLVLCWVWSETEFWFEIWSPGFDGDLKLHIYCRRTYVYVKSPLRRLLGAGGKAQPASVLFCLSRVLSSEENRLGTWLDLTVINVTALPLICITVMLVGLL